MRVSRAFKVFLLMLLSFAAVWAYNSRARELRGWLELGGPPALESDRLSGLGSPVDQVISPGEGALLLGRLRFEPSPRLAVVAAPSASALPEEASVEDGEAGEDGAFAPSIPPGENGAFPPSVPPGGDFEGEPIIISLRAPSPRPPPEPAPREKVPERPARSSPAPLAKSSPPQRPAAPPKGQPASDPRTLGSTALAGGPLEGKRAAREAPRTLSHLVRPRETLASLARRYYQNDTERWREIFIANQDQIADPHRLSPGLVLNIPGAILWREPSAGKDSSSKPASRPSRTRPSGGGGALPPPTQGGGAAGGPGGRARGANG